jgi:hypothetical protein
VKYLPTFDLIRRMVEVSTVKGELRVSLSYDDFIKIMRLMISGIEVNQDWYLEEHQDIAQAVTSGTVASAKQHSWTTAISRAGGRFRCRSMNGGIWSTMPMSPRACARAS